MKEEPNHLSPEELAKAERIAWLLAAFIRKDISPRELDELDEWVSASDRNVLLFEELTDEKNLDGMIDALKLIDTKAALEKAKAIRQRQQSRPKPYYRRLIPYMAAATVACLAIGLWYSAQRPSNQVQQSISINNDVAPGGNKAVLTLADGTTILLDSAANGKLAMQGNAALYKNDSGSISYNIDQSKGETSTAWNTLATPRGGQYQLTLGDGTRVWLNASSSIKYPASFEGKNRTVELVGEAYFEVAKNAAKPFQVKIKNGLVEVLGTHFNINAYDDEQTVKTTLTEGSVRISSGDKSMLLKPGQQAALDNSGNINLVEGIDLEDALAWQTGWFSFHRANIGSLMRQVQRWYDVEIIYNEKPTLHFNGAIKRDLPVSRMLQLLEGTGKVHFQVKDKTIFVNP